MARGGARGIRRVDGRGAAALAASALALAACAGRFGRPPGPELRLDAPPEVRWETRGPHRLTLAIRNAGGTAVELPRPSPSAAAVSLLAASGASPVCRSAPAEPPPGAGVRLSPGERREVTVTLEGCALAPGGYRYEAWYALPRGGPEDGPRRLGPERGRVVVRPAASDVALPASRGAVSPPAHAEPPVPPQPNPHLARPIAPAPRSLACVDRELARRGLNAFGDPAATVYPDGPPAFGSDVERERMILERYPDVGTLCRIPP